MPDPRGRSEHRTRVRSRAVGLATAEEVIELLVDGTGLDTVGPIGGVPLVVVRVADDAATSRCAGLLRRMPCVGIGVDETGDLPSAASALDILLTQAKDPPAPWVGSEAAADHEAISEAVARSPEASVTLVQLLRIGEVLDRRDALIAESLAYGLLQGGRSHREWLSSRPLRDCRPLAGRPGDATDSAVLLERTGDALRVTLNRPAVRNAYNTAMRDGLVGAFQLGAIDPTITSIEVDGAGASFCSGGDLTEFGTVPDAVTGHLVRSSRSPAWWLAESRPAGGRGVGGGGRGGRRGGRPGRGGDGGSRVRGRGGAPVSFFVHGPCVGAGVELPAFGTEVSADPATTFRLPEVAMGLVPGAGGTASLPARIGRHRTAHLAISGGAIDAATALGWGLVDRVAVNGR